MESKLPRAVQELVDRQEILACLGRYARGLDRRDIELVKSVYHQDAIDHHGALGDYTPDTLVNDWLRRDAHRCFSQHLILDTTIDFDGDVAHAETYYQLVTGATSDSERPGLRLSGGRYVDRFERRAAEWRIARRVVISEYQAKLDSVDLEQHRRWSRRNREDPSYQRPLSGPPGSDTAVQPIPGGV